MGFDGVHPLVMTKIAIARSTIFNGKIHHKWRLSIAMLNYRRVSIDKPTLVLHILCDSPVDQIIKI